MDPRKVIISLAAIFLIFSGVAAAYTIKRFVPLKDTTGIGASGEVTIERMGFMPAQRELSIDVFRLKPNSTYSVWLTNVKPELSRHALGVDVNHFRTDGGGKGRYVTTTSEYDLSHWRYIDIYLHPDNDPKNTKDMALSLRGDLKYGYHS